MQLNLKADLITSLEFKYIPFKKDYKISNGCLVWANPNLYLQGAGAQHIDTGIIGDGKKTTFDFVYSSKDDNQAIFGSRVSSSSRNLSFVQLTGFPHGRFDYSAAGSGYDISANQNQKNHIVSTIKDEQYIVCNYSQNGKVLGTFSKTLSSFTTPSAMVLFARRDNSTVGAFTTEGKIYYFKIYEEGVLVRHFVPVPQGLEIGNFTCPSNGMFDIVNQQFYANLGTGDFIYGKDE